MFTLVCSNEQERHAMTTTYRHRFRLELEAVIHERRNLNRFRYRGTGDPVSPTAAGAAAAKPCASSPQSRSSNTRRQPNKALVGGARTLPGERPGEAKPKTFYAAPEAFPLGNDGGGKGKRRREGGVTAEEFSEALVRCPEILEAFGSQLVARLRHRHRPSWMAPILRKGG